MGRRDVHQILAVVYMKSKNEKLKPTIKLKMFFFEYLYSDPLQLFYDAKQRLEIRPAKIPKTAFPSEIKLNLHRIYVGQKPIINNIYQIKL